MPGAALGSVTQEAQTILAMLHGSVDAPVEEGVMDPRLKSLLRYLDDKLDISSLGALARAFHDVEEPPSPHGSEVNDLLAAVDVRRVSTLLLMSVVRFTCRSRGVLPAWYALRDDAAREFKKREPGRWREILTGLLEHEP